MKFGDMSFDQRAALYQENPKEYDRQAMAWLNEQIETTMTPEQQWKAKRTQINLNKALRNYKHPVARCNKLVELMFGEVLKMSQGWSQVTDKTCELVKEANKTQQSFTKITKTLKGLGNEML